MRKTKIIFNLILIIFIAIVVLFFTMPFVCMYPFLYIKYSLNPEKTPRIMEDIIKANPRDVYDIEQLLYKNRISPRKNEPDFQSYIKELERITVRYMAEKKLNSLDIHWYHDEQQTDKVKYIVDYETRTAWGRTKANLGDLSDSTIYYFVLDRNLSVLGWAKE